MSKLYDPRILFLGNSSIGLFGFSTDTYTVLPSNIKKRTKLAIEQQLKTKQIIASISNSYLNGLFAVGNSHNILVPSLISETEFQTISNQLPDDVNFHIMDSKITALGNTIVLNNKVALVHQDFNKSEKLLIGDLMDVEVIAKSFSNGPLIGSMIFLSSNGFLTHPLFQESEIEWLNNYFGVQGDIVTINRGTPYPRLGIIANKNGVLVGSDTTGPEILRISEVLGTF